MNKLVDGRYELLEVIASGGMATVWRARDVKLERAVALKRPHPVPPGDPRSERLAREARAAARISHPHLVSVHDVGSDEDGLYLIMELVEAPSLADVGARLDRRRILEVGVQISRALAAVHRAGVVHRDVKPANILLAEGGAKLTDFGIATDSRFDHHQPTTPGLMLATAEYAAPEVLSGHPATDRADIFGLGVVLYGLLAGRPPFVGTDRTARPPTINDPAGPVVEQCLSPYPGERPDAKALAVSLSAVLDAAPSAPARRPVSDVAPLAAGPAAGLTQPGSLSGDGSITTVMNVGAAPTAGNGTGAARFDPTATVVAPPGFAGSVGGGAGDQPPAGWASGSGGPASGGPPRVPPTRAWVGPAVLGAFGVAALFVLVSLILGAVGDEETDGESASVESTEGADDPNPSVTVPTPTTVVEDEQGSETDAGGDDGAGDDADNDSGSDAADTDEDGGDDGGFGGGFFDSIDAVDDFFESVEERAQEVENRVNEVEDRINELNEIRKKVDEAVKLVSEAKPEKAADKLEEAARKVDKEFEGSERERLLAMLDQMAEQLGLPEADYSARFAEDGD